MVTKSSFKRTDLALFDLDAQGRTITCRLIEVKCYNQIGDIGAYNELKNSIAEQIAQSEEVISYHFDPQRSLVDRPDRLVKTREFSTLLEFYLNRAIRYRTMSDDAAEEARFFLRTLEDGYRLNFARAALIFDFDKPGTEAPDLESGIEYHRIGADLIQQLINVVASEPGTPEEPAAEGQALARTHGDVQIARMRERPPAVPALDEAAFLGRPRDRSVSWEDLAARRTLGKTTPALPRRQRIRMLRARIAPASPRRPIPTSLKRQRLGTGISHATRPYQRNPERNLHPRLSPMRTSPDTTC